jgi:hypothetical protein
MTVNCANCPYLRSDYSEDFDGRGESLLQCTKTEIYFERWEVAKQERDESCPLTLDEYKASLKLWEKNIFDEWFKM